MMIVKFRASESKDTLKKLKKMHKISKELIECFEDKMNEEEDDDYDEDFRGGSYREDEDWREEDPRMRSRYRRGGMR